MISVVAWSLIEECPADIAFFLRIRGWTELSLMAIIFLSTIFYSLTLGIAIGVGLSLLQVIRHSTRPRIQILGRIPGTHRFENAEVVRRQLYDLIGALGDAAEKLARSATELDVDLPGYPSVTVTQAERVAREVDA